MAGETGLLLGLAHALASLTYVFGVLMQTLPIPRREWKAWGPTLMWDACIAEVAIGTVAAVQLAVSAISNLLGSSFGGPFTSPNLSFSLILAQLVMIDVATVLLISAVSATVVFAPVAEILSRILGSAVSSCTAAIIVWSTIKVITALFPGLWLVIYEVGLCFYSIPFRIGRRLASYFMSSSIVMAIGLPPMPSMAIWLEGYIGYQAFAIELQNILGQMQRNPLAAVELIGLLPLALGNLMAAIIIALIVFPIAYLFILSVIARSLANVLGGASAGPAPSIFVLAPAREITASVKEA